MRNVLSQKFRHRKVTERNETTIVKKSVTDEESLGVNEYNKNLCIKDEINEEQFYSSSSNTPRILHGTQSLHDARTSSFVGRNEFSNEFPQILSDQNLPREQKNYRHSIIVPIERKEEKDIINNEQSENFLRRQQQKLYKLHGSSLRKFGQSIAPQGLDEQQRRARQHASLPPMGRPNQYFQQTILQQLPFELTIDRYPPQIVRSIDTIKQLDVWTVSDSGINYKRHEFPQEGSFGFSPFPVHGPFMADELLVQNENKQINKRQESKESGTYDFMKNVGMNLSAVMSSSDELWHSAYECFPQQKSSKQSQFQQTKIPNQKDEEQQISPKSKILMSILAEENGSECNIQKNFHLQNLYFYNLKICRNFPDKINLNVKYPKIMATNKQIEISTLSEQKANEEVRLLMHKGIIIPTNKLMSKSVESTVTLEGEEKELERAINNYNRQPVRVEISGPVHFLHATNMNVMNNSDNQTEYSIQTSMSSTEMKESNKGIFEIHQNFLKQRKKSPSPTKWTQTDNQFENNKRQNQVISPPLESFIDNICNIEPILTEISETLCHKGILSSEILKEQYLNKKDKVNKNIPKPPPVPPKKISLKRPKYIYKIEEETKQNEKTSFNSNFKSSFNKELIYQNPYLIQSTSHCHLARVTEITQEWLIQFNNNLKRINDENIKQINLNCNIIIRPTFGKEYANEEFWTMAWKEKLNIDNIKNNNNGDQAIYLTDNEINKNYKKFNNFGEQQFSTLQIQNRRTKSRQFNENIHKTRSYNDDELPRLIEHNKYDELRRALLQVQKDLDSAQEYKRQNNNVEAERIENVILSISERIKCPNDPVSKAQAEAKEELLRVKLARMILNFDPDFEPKQQQNNNEIKDNNNNNLSNENIFADIALESYYVRALREPISLLHEKLALLEHRLLSEQQFEINNQLKRIPQISRNFEQKNKKELFNQRNDEIMRMTPLIVMLRHKLNTLDDLCKKEQIKADSNVISGRLTPYEDRKTVYELLVRINAEIDNIHKLCREENVKERIEIVLGVLKKVSSSIDRIMETLKNMSSSSTVTILRPTSSTSSLSDTKKNNSSNINRPIIYQQSKLEQAILNKQKGKENQTFLQRMKAKQQYYGKTEIILKEENKNNKFRTKNKNEYISIKNSKNLKQNNFKSFDEGNEIINKRNKTPPQVPPKRKSLTSLIEERIGPLYSIVEEYPSTLKKTNISKQRVNNVELSAYLDRPYEITSRVNAYIPLLTTRTATRIESPPLSPSTITNPQHLEINKNINSDLTNFSKQFKDQSNFRLGPCPSSYLNNHDNQRQQQQRFIICQKPSRICNSIDDDDVEECVSVSITSSAMDNNTSSCLSVPILFRRNSALSSVTTSASNFQHETAILDEEIEAEETCTETFFLRRRNKHSILNAIIYPEQHASVKATFCGNNFQVDVERMSECGRDSVVMVSEEFCEKKVIIRSGSPLLKSTILEEIERENSDSPGYTDAHTRMAISINAKSDYDSVHVFLEEIPWGQIGLEVKEYPTILNTNKKNKAIITNDNNRYNQNIGMSSSISSSHSRESILKQISVSEGSQQRGNNNNNNDDISGRFSLRSASRRSSQKSLANSTGSGTTTILVGGQEDDFDDIPAYVIKIGSTASITCELNSEFISNMENIEWIRGQNEQIICTENGKFERNFHDFVEVLIIYNVNHEDGQLYSVKINNEIYPVAYLIIEEEEEEEIENNNLISSDNNNKQNKINESTFLTSPQTQFVMQGETAIISVSMNKANLDVFWHKEGQILDSTKLKGNNRILFESTTNGWYRIIIQNVQFSDQGFYFAQIGDKFTSVQLIVEDRIDEREVQVSSAETDDEDLGDYLVPIGSTATIACELENVSFGYHLHWQRNHKDLDSRIVSDEGKFEHVVNGKKHYLIIHCAQPFDSGVYSVRIGNSKFKVAQITISNEQKLSNGSSSTSRIKRISSQSLNSRT